jgi:hypothetical protein
MKEIGLVTTFILKCTSTNAKAPLGEMMLFLSTNTKQSPFITN